MGLAEHSEPFEFDPQDLERGAFMNSGGKRTAHPKLDPETGEMVWFAYFAGPEAFSNLIDYGVTDKSGNVTCRDRFAAPYAAMVHNFMVTRNYVMFPVAPLTGEPARAMKRNAIPGRTPAMLDFARIWQAVDKIDKIVYSKSLEKVSTSKTRLKRKFDPQAVRDLKSQL